MTTSADEIRWPDGCAPADSDVFVSNELNVSAPPEVVWAWLVRAERWPEWFREAADIHFTSHSGPDLRDRSRFRWTMRGYPISSKVVEWEPVRRLAWRAHGIGVEAHHAWLLMALPNEGTRVLTQETQTGWLARLYHRFFPERLATRHQHWLESLAAQAATGMPTGEVSTAFASAGS